MYFVAHKKAHRFDPPDVPNLMEIHDQVDLTLTEPPGYFVK